MNPTKTTQKGYVTWQHGFLAYSHITPPAADVCWQSKKWVANASLEQAIKFVAYINFIELPKTTNIHVVRSLFHNHSMHTLLKDNGIDMFPVDRPEASQRKSMLLHRLVNYLKLVKTARNWFPRL